MSDATWFFGGAMTVTRITPEQYAKGGSEHSEQVAVFIWANDQALAGFYPDELNSMFAIPNGGLRNKATAGRLKAEGAKKGVVDIFLPTPRMNFQGDHLRGWYHGLFVEMKPKRVANVRNTDPEFGATPEQREFITTVKRRGYAATVCHGWIEATDVIASYLKLPAGGDKSSVWRGQ